MTNSNIELADSFEKALKEDGIVPRISLRMDLPQEIAQRIKQLITSNYLNPGDPLPSEAKLCRVFGIGRSTVREAAKILKAENILIIKKGVGTFISDRPGLIKDPLGVSLMNQEKMLANLMETRLIIEPNIAFLAAQRATRDNILKLEKIMIDTDRINLQHNSHMEVDMAFHNAIAEATQNDIVFRIVPIINESIAVGYQETYNMISSFEKAIKLHRDVYEAIKLGEAENAKNAMKCHLIQSMDDILLKQKIKKENVLRV